MRCRYRFVFILLLTLFTLQSRVNASDLKDANKALLQAKKCEKEFQYRKALAYYDKCYMLFSSLDNAKARQCLLSQFRINRIKSEYPYGREDVIPVLRKKFPFVSGEEQLSWIDNKRIDFINYDGKPHYYEAFDHNILFRNMDLLHRYYTLNPPKKSSFFTQLHTIALKEYNQTASPYINPKEFVVSGQMVLYRNELPEKGILQIWVPMAIETAAQRNVEVVYAEPNKYLKNITEKDAELGLFYFEIILEDLHTDLHIAVKFKFIRYQEQFAIDPSRIKPYEKGSSLYKYYTRSYANTLITDAIRKEAESVTKGISNPYIAAKKIYDSVINNIDYSLMPHLSLAELKQPESVYAYLHKYGDCGTQSLYFSALCRAVGIPARSTGGWQLVPGLEGTHFWAEIYLPPYGWVPVDTTMAETADWEINLNQKEREEYKAYFFTHLDPYRMVFQKDIDVPLSPVPLEAVDYLLAVQAPVVSCSTAKTDLDMMAKLRWKFDIETIDRSQKKKQTARNQSP